MQIKQGDCLEELHNLKDSSIDMIYMDPPFFTQKKQVSTSKSKKDISFDDSWSSEKSFEEYMYIRIMECYRVLKETGSIFVHCDKNATYIFRKILNEIFGEKNFQSEIIWTYKRWSNSKKGLLNSHQTIYFFSKTSKFKFNKVYTDYSVTTNVDQLLQERKRDNQNKTVYKRDPNGNTLLVKSKKGVPLSDVWNIPYLNPRAKERVGYPTQKPIALLERIITISTDPGDVVLDPFCGSGTTLVAAKLLDRKYIGYDISNDAIDISKHRVQKPIRTESSLLRKGAKSYITKDKRSLALLEYIGAKPVFRNKGIDGIINDTASNTVILVKIQRSSETLFDTVSLLKNAMNKKKISHGIVFKTHNSVDNDIYIYDSFEENIKIIEDPILSMRH